MYAPFSIDAGFYQLNALVGEKLDTQSAVFWRVWEILQPNILTARAGIRII
jgi:hypothetical protein